MLALSLLLLLSLSCSSYSMLIGWVESPGYPVGYSPHVSFNWSRCAPKGQTLSIRLIHLDMEDSKDCENDVVKVISNGNLLAALCGKKEFEELEDSVNPLLFSTPGGCLTLLFHSDYSNTKRHAGFRGFYTTQDFNECEDPHNECTQFCHNFIGGYQCSCRHGYQLADDKHTCSVSCSEDLSGLDKGQISSPPWPGPYFENANCKFTLSVEKHLQVELHFEEGFDVEESSDGCCIDSLRVETQHGILGPYCNSNPPPSTLPTHSSHVQIHFTSDGFGTNKGFSLNFRTAEMTCAPAVISNSTVEPKQSEYHQGETVTVSCDTGYVANLGLLTKYETTCQSTGLWGPSYPCEIVDCGLPLIKGDSILQIIDSDDRNTQYMGQIQFKCTSNYYKLEGNDTYTCSKNGEWVSPEGNFEMPKCIEVCGMPGRYSMGRILGGEKANLGEIPWQLLIKSPKRGAASLINDRWAVTAAHVVDGVNQNVLDMYGRLVDGQSQTSYKFTAEKIIIHPNYTKVPFERQTNFDNDIALIKFNSRVTFDQNLLPICLPEVNRDMLENEYGTVSGWGQSDKKRIKTRFLHYVHIPVLSKAVCEDTPLYERENSRIKMPFTENMFCAGAEGMDSCSGDSGGPFSSPMLASSGPHFLTGIVSWGSDCIGDNVKGMKKGYYTKVGKYVSWIKNKMEENSTL